MPNRAEGSPTTKVGKVSKHSLPDPSPGSGLPLILSQNCVCVSPMAGGVMGVSAGNRPPHGPFPGGISSISIGKGSAHGSISPGSCPESDGLRLTL